MDRRSPGRIIAGCFALSGFSVAVFASLGAGATVETILLRAIYALLACYIVGGIVGAIGERCIRDGFEDFTRRQPLPQPSVIEVSAVDDSGRDSPSPTRGAGGAS